MKKSTMLLIALIIALSSISYTFAEKALQINGISIPLISKDGKQISIKEIDGTIYLPAEIFLKALGLEYTINDDSISVTYQLPSDNAEVDEYANLIPEEKLLVDLILEKAHKFKNPSTISVKSILYYLGAIESDTALYIIDLSAQNGFGGNTSECYQILYGDGLAFWTETTEEQAAELAAITKDEFQMPDFNYGRINRAIRQKVEELGY